METDVEIAPELAPEAKKDDSLDSYVIDEGLAPSLDMREQAGDSDETQSDEQVEFAEEEIVLGLAAETIDEEEEDMGVPPSAPMDFGDDQKPQAPLEEAPEAPEGAPAIGEAPEEPEGVSAIGAALEEPESELELVEPLGESEGAPDIGEASGEPESDAGDSLGLGEYLKDLEDSFGLGEPLEEPEGAPELGEPLEEPEGAPELGEPLEEPEGDAEEGTINPDAISEMRDEVIDEISELPPPIAESEDAGVVARGTEQARPAPSESGALPPDALGNELRDDMRRVLGYLDNLFDELPEERVKEFANSKYYDIYNRLFKELGI